MLNFPRLTKKAFENYHNAPVAPKEWGFTDAIGHIMEFMERHESIDEMQGLRKAVESMKESDWKNWRERYPEHQATLIDPLYEDVFKQRA